MSRPRVGRFGAGSRCDVARCLDPWSRILRESRAWSPGAAFATPGGVTRVGNLSGKDCVSALVALGFEIRHDGKGTTVLRRGGRIVMVPHVDALNDELVDAIARSAGVTKNELALARVGGMRMRSGTYRKHVDDDATDESKES